MSGPWGEITTNGPAAFGHSEEAIAHQILSGAFFGFLPSHLGQPFEVSLQMRRIGSKNLTSTTPAGILQSAREKENPLARAFLEGLQNGVH